MSALDIILHDLDLDDYTPSFLGEAEKELRELRAADIRTMEHCDCGCLLYLEADAPEDADPYCPVCALEKFLAERDAAIERMHKALIDVIEHQSELNNSYGRPISHSKTIALALSGLNEDAAAAIRARGEKGAK